MAGVKGKSGRPKSNPADRRSLRLAISLTPTQAHRLDLAAAKASMTPSTYVYMLVVSALTPPVSAVALPRTTD